MGGLLGLTPKEARAKNPELRLDFTFTGSPGMEEEFKEEELRIIRICYRGDGALECVVADPQYPPDETPS